MGFEEKNQARKRPNPRKSAGKKSEAPKKLVKGLLPAAVLLSGAFNVSQSAGQVLFDNGIDNALEDVSADDFVFESGGDFNDGILRPAEWQNNWAKVIWYKHASS